MYSAKRVISGTFRRIGFDFSRDKKEEPVLPPDFDAETQALCRLVRPFTMTSPERLFALREAIKHIVRHKIEGDIVECGVWKGGSMMAAAKTLLELKLPDRNLYLFDTFEGMPAPGAQDVSLENEPAADLMSKSDRQSRLVWAYSTLEEARSNLRSIGYPEDRMFFTKGKLRRRNYPAKCPPSNSSLTA